MISKIQFLPNKGKLEINQYLEFCLMPLANHPIKQLKAWHQQFMVDKIQPILLEKAQKVYSSASTAPISDKNSPHKKSLSPPNKVLSKSNNASAILINIIN
jgi:hypothetical protein